MEHFEFRPFDEKMDLELVLNWLIKTKEAVSMTADAENERNLYFNALRKVQSRNPEYTAILMRNSEPVGFVNTFPVGKHPEISWLDFCYLVPEVRGTRASEVLVERIIRIASDNGCRKIRLSVHRDNARGIAFYRKNGWELMEAKDDDLMRMVKLLD